MSDTEIPARAGSADVTRSGQTPPPPRTRAALFIYMRGEIFFCLSVIYSYEAFLCCCCSVSKVCCLESDHTGHDLLTAGSDT